MDAFQYDQLSLTQSSIRLVRILPESTPEEIHISLHIANLNDAPDFDALSYTWGRPFTIFPSQAERDAPPEPPVPIVCDGKRLLVGKNLHDYLQVWLRMSEVTWEGTDQRVQQAKEKGLHPPQALWIDAICINQVDLAEKNHQVGIMGRIYSQAHRVVVWLGPEDGYVRPALALLFKLTNVSLEKATDMRNLPDHKKSEVLGLPSLTSSAWWPVFAFISRSWFARAWIVQELALAPRLHVQCGQLSFNWSALAHACHVLYNSRLDEGLEDNAFLEMKGPRILEPYFYDDMMPIIRQEERPDDDRHLFGSRKGRQNSTLFVVTLEKIRRAAAIHLREDFAALLKEPYYIKRGNGVPFFELLEDSRETDCFDPRDKIYAFLAIAKQPYYQSKSSALLRYDIVADYRLSTAEVYTQAAWYVLLSGQKLNLLSVAYKLAPEEEGSIPGLPSWVPDWSCKKFHTSMTGLHAFMTDQWYAGGHSSWDAPADDKLHRPYLTVQGSLVDTICAVAEDSNGVSDFVISKSGVVAAQLPEVYPWVIPPQRSGEVLWRTLIADSTEDQHPAPDFNVLFYNDVWLVEMSRAAREQFDSSEKDREWQRFIKAHTPLFVAVHDDLKRPDSSSHVPGPSSVTVDPEEWVRDTLPETSVAIQHLESAAETGLSGAMSQLDIALGQMARGAGFKLSSDSGFQEDEEAAAEEGKRTPTGDAEQTAVQDEEQELAGNQSGENDQTAEPMEGETASVLTKLNQEDPFEPEFRRLVRRFTRARTVFRTEKHYFGNGLKTVEVGDQVWLLSGAKVPMILRPLDSGRFALVGEAYVHGLMHGEAWFGKDFALREVELE